MVGEGNECLLSCIEKDSEIESPTVDELLTRLEDWLQKRLATDSHQESLEREEVA